MPRNNGNGKEKGNGTVNVNNGTVNNGTVNVNNGNVNGNNDIVPITKINTTNQNKKGKIKNKNMLIATEEGQLPYMCIIS